MHIVTHNVEETLALGRIIGRIAPPHTTIALHGSLGAGKTHLTRGIAEGAEVEDPALVSSPTYVLLNIYPGPKPVYHLDAYRIAGPDDFAAVGFEELTGAGAENDEEAGIVVVEWAERIVPLLPTDHLSITIELQDKAHERGFEFAGTGPAARKLSHAIADAWKKAKSPKSAK